MSKNSLVWKLRRLPGKLKGYYTRLGFYKLLLPITNFFHFLHYLNLQGKWISKNKKQAEYTDYYSSTFDYKKRELLFEHAIENKLKSDDFKYLEFGVARGLSFFWWLNRIKNPGCEFHGFDTFSGLPEDWGGFKKGDMHNDDQVPKSDDPRAFFHKGLFQDTLPDFIKSSDLSGRLVIHLDADLYTATYYVLNYLAPYLKKGDLIFFDEFSVPLSEFKAFIEFQRSHYIDIKLVGSVNNFYQAVFIIE